MEIKPKEIIYKKTEDADTVRKYNLQIEDISVGQLKREISVLEEELKNISKEKEKPDEETLGFWNAFAVAPAEPIEGLIKEKTTLLDKLTAAK